MVTSLHVWLLFVITATITASAASSTPSREAKNSSCRPDALVQVGFARFCVLTSRMLRMEWAAGGSSSFRDDQTLLAQQRWMDDIPVYAVAWHGSTVILTTQHLQLEYDSSSTESFSDANLRVTLRNFTHTNDAPPINRWWTPSLTDKIRQEALPGTIRTLDGVNGTASLDCLAEGPEYASETHCTPALFSRENGYVILDDSLSATFDDDPVWPWLKKPSNNDVIPSTAACAAIPSRERRICGMETVTETQCLTQGCCFSNTSIIDAVQTYGEGSTYSGEFHCYYSTESYQDLYFLGYGHDFKGALQEFTLFSGKIPLPPRFAFGVFYSRWWAYSDFELQHQIVEQYEQHRLPLDVVVLDMDWHLTFYKDHESDQAGQPKGWTGLTWNKQLFPRPKQFLKWLHSKGLAVTLNLHPASGVQPWEASYFAVAKALGINPLSQRYVPFQLTNKTFAEIWLNISIGALEDDGVDFWWLDWQQGENWFQIHDKRTDITPTIWLNHVFFTNPHHWKRTRARPLLMHRFGGLGNHRYPIGFSGDVIASWESLRFQPYFTTMAANVGFGYWSHDLGGFQSASEPELFTRWLQWGAFAPVFRTHSIKRAWSDRRIWKYSDDVYEIARAAMELRAALAPYIYNEARAAHDTGLSVVHSVFMHWPEHDEAYSFTEQYMFGQSLLVSPIVTPVHNITKLAAKVVWLPPGVWYDFTTGSLIEGPRVLSYNYTMSEIPHFAKAGAILPLAVQQTERNSIGQLSHVPLTLRLVIVPGLPKSQLSLYEDDGLSREYLDGHYTRTLFDFHAKCPFDVNERSRLRNQRPPVSYFACSEGTAQFMIHPIDGFFSSMPTKRSYQVEFRGALPAALVTINNEPIFPRPIASETDTGDGYSYSAETLSLVIFVNTRDVRNSITISIKFINATVDLSGLILSGVMGQFARLHAVKQILDDQWGMDTVYMSDYPGFLVASETDQRISYQPETIADELLGFHDSLRVTIQELHNLQGLNEDVRSQVLAFLTTSAHHRMQQRA